MRSVKIQKMLLVHALLLGVGLAFLTGSVFAQHIRNTEHSPDKVLKSNARVNPSTLAMEMSIPLIGYAGRAGNGRPVTLSYSSKVWGMDNYGSIWQNNLNMTINDIRPRYAKDTAAGWSSSLGAVRLDFSWDVYREAADQAPETEGQIYAPPTWEVPGENRNLYYVRRVRVIMPAGTAHEMRASDAPVVCGDIAGGNCTGNDYTGTFLSVDGSRMRLESATASSTLYLPDGSRYLFGAKSGVLALAHTYLDGHGNKSTYNTTTRAWTDTMGRVLADPMPDNFVGQLDQWGSVQKQTVGIVEMEFPGVGGDDPYEVDIEWAELEDVLLNSGDPLKYTGRRACSGNGSTPVSPYLFEDGSDTHTRLCKFGGLFNPVVLHKITLPNGQGYEFRYNVHGEIAKITYPTGAYERFAYELYEPLAPSSGPYEQANRGVTDRWVSETGDETDELHWTYAVSLGSHYTVTTTAPDGSYTQQRLYMEQVTIPMNPYGFGKAYTGRPYEERAYDSSSSHNLRSRKLTAYQVTGPVGTGAYWTATRDMRPTKEVLIIFEPGNSNALATMTETVYDTADVVGSTDPAYFSSLNPKQSKTYHYVVVNASTAATADITTASAWFSDANPATVTEIDYLYDANYKARNINGLVTETRVKDAAGNVKARTQIGYDDVGTYPLLTDVSSTRWEDPNTNYRGLVTTTKSWSDVANNLFVTTHTQYDRLGNARKSWDGNGNLSQVEYSSVYDHAYPTKTISPIPDGNGSTTAFETTVIYDYNTGLPTSTTDANGQTTQMEYNDPLLRPTKTIAPNGHQTITEYGAGTSAATRFVKVKSQIDEQKWKEGYSWYDGLGRTVKTQSVDSAGDVFVETEYDNMGRVKRVTNPYRTGETKLWTENFYDTAGRLFKVKTPDGAEVETAYGVATTGSHIGTVETVTDQAEKQRRSITNALGQLTRVDEPNNAGQLGSIGAPNQPTFYAYDTLNNLTTVSQGVQTRTFTYNSLSRLLSATNPELGTTPTNGTILYQYDNNGNVTQKTDPRGVVTNYVYDALNRVMNRNYSTPGGTPPNYQATPNVTYFYDNLPNAKGKLIKVSSSVSTTEYTAFDILGRVTRSKQTTDGVVYGTDATPMTYTYNLSGALIEQAYPSGRIVKNVLDNDGDLAMVQSKKTANHGFFTFANSFTYTAAGAVSSMQLGNGKWESTVFNPRLQPTQIALGQTQNATNLLKLDYSYGGTNNNGNVQSQTITVPTVGQNPGFTAVQNYTYDSLNRLKSATENIDGNPTPSWKQTFTFDRYGNRRFDTANNNTTTLPPSCPEAICNPQINTANNRLIGYQFDNSGNTTVDAENRTFIYDAENKQKEVRNSQSQVVGQYFYDGDGNRVKKIVPSPGETTIFVYDASGKLVAEYSTIVAPPQDAKASYLTNDYLGSPRINTDQNGSVNARHDYHPFGEEIVGTGGRTVGLGYGDDDVRKKFTGYERDNEIEMDFAQARYFAYNHGRFTSPDPLAASANAFRPQSWNRYTYSYNNPLRYTDPSGMIAGDFYNQDGDYLGTDGINDGKLYVVMNKDQAKQIQKTDKNKGTTQVSAVSSAIELPSLMVRQAVGAAVDRSNSPTADDKKGGFHEEGLIAGPAVAGGQETVQIAAPGAVSDPRVDTKATIDTTNPANPAQAGTLADITVKAHVHPSGVLTSSSGPPLGGGTTVIGGTVTTSRADFVQTPSAVDIQNASALPGVTHIVAGARSKTVYVYNGSGVRATFPLQKFITITPGRR